MIRFHVRNNQLQIPVLYPLDAEVRARGKPVTDAVIHLASAETHTIPVDLPELDYELPRPIL